MPLTPTSRRVAWALAGAAAVAAVLWLFYSRSRSEPEPRYETATVDRGRIIARVTATGTLSALVTVQIGSQVSGRIQGLFVDYNSPVKKGQVLARLDPQFLEAAREQSRANLAAAQGNLSKANIQALEAGRQHQRLQSLAGRQLVSEAELDAAQAAAQAGRAEEEIAAGAVEQARAALHQADVNLAYTTIVSPIDGVVISRSVDVGQTVAASLQAPTLFMIAEDLRKMQVNTSVAEADVGKLSSGIETTFTVDAFPGERFRGTVRQIRNAPQTVQNVVTYDAVIDVDNPERKLKPGMTANVTFVYAEKSSALRVPNAALRFRPPPELLPALRRNAGEEEGDEERRTVWVLRGEETPEPARVRIGISDGALSEVLEGDLREGDTVVVDAAETDAGGRPSERGMRGLRRVF